METTQKLDPEFKAKWVAALRSGEYKQGKCQLYDQKDNSFCCLGVACHVASGKLPLDWYYFIPEKADLHPGFSHADDVPELLRGGAGIPGTLAKMNDGVVEYDRPLSFSEIADYIEENL